MRAFLAADAVSYILGTARVSRDPLARHFGVASPSGQLVAIASRVDVNAAQLPMLAVAANSSCTADQLGQLLRVATHDGSPGRLATSLAWGDEPSREVLAKAGLALAGCASCDGISEVVLVVTDDTVMIPDAERAPS